MSFLEITTIKTAPVRNTTTSVPDVKYSAEAVKAYAATNHGPDGALFMDAYFKPFIENLHGEKVIDAGCGAAPWTIYAAEHGGNAYGIELQEDMVIAAIEAINLKKLEGKVDLKQGDVSKLPYKDSFFDRAISVCVGCNLPNGIFEKHFSELQRTLKNDGMAIITAPYSLDVVFTNNDKNDQEVESIIDSVLEELPDNPSRSEISVGLMKLDMIRSATFYIKGKRLARVKDVRALEKGQQIWRKLSKLVIPNCFHSGDEYLENIKKYNLELTKLEEPRFENEKERGEYNKFSDEHSHLGLNYSKHPSFAIYHIKKK